MTALEPLVFPRISTEIALVIAPIVDGMLGQPVALWFKFPALDPASAKREVALAEAATSKPSCLGPSPR